ncbi:MAG: 4-alpha-glucanotransferase, partial [Epulopiscium sp.]|nr:4-alpha-glucanotransferase [Candidatus Epulonipiscium sp.]
AFIKDHSYDIGFWEFVQYKFFTQWFSLRRYALTKGIKIIGDMPIYVAYDSADVWLNKGLFLLGKNFLPLKVAGVPPDLFSESGQLWGNPLYDWSAMEKNGFDWWLRRFRFNSIMYDILRIDHFRGFASFYAVDYGRKDAVIGSWMDAPGEKLFELVSDKFPDLEIIAEDLGYITPDVENLLRKTGFPGMRVLQFGFDCNTDNPHHPDNYPYNCFAYTGTHDNQTTFAWYKDTDNKQREEIRRYTNETDPDRITDALIKAVLDSRAKTAIIPMQDYMRLGDEARMNTPSTVTGNWTWRLKEDYADDLLTDRILHMAVNSGRTLEK